MILLIDNYDSFTYNLFHYLGELGAAVEVRRNDEVSVAEVMAMHPQGIILSPGPCDPDRAGICLELIEAAAGKVPILGVCLGHQAIGQAFGGKVVRGPVPMHGKLTAVQHRGEGIFEGIPSPFMATRYHSLIVERASLPELPRRDGGDRERPDHGHGPSHPAHPRRAVPSREHRLGAWPSPAGQFPAARRAQRAGPGRGVSDLKTADRRRCRRPVARRA